MVASHGRARVESESSILAVLLVATVAQAVDFQLTFWREGPERPFAFDVPVQGRLRRSSRAVAAANLSWRMGSGVPRTWMRIGTPLWKAGLYREFVRLPDGAKPPPGAIVLSSNSDCQNCEVIKKYLQYELYKAK